MAAILIILFCFKHIHVNKLINLFAGKVATGTVIGTLLGEVVHLSFCFCDERVAACSGATVCILSSKVKDDARFTFSLGAH